MREELGNMSGVAVSRISQAVRVQRRKDSGKIQWAWKGVDGGDMNLCHIVQHVCSEMGIASGAVVLGATSPFLPMLLQPVDTI